MKKLLLTLGTVAAVAAPVAAVVACSNETKADYNFKSTDLEHNFAGFSTPAPHLSTGKPVTQAEMEEATRDKALDSLATKFLTAAKKGITTFEFSLDGAKAVIFDFSKDTFKVNGDGTAQTVTAYLANNHFFKLENEKLVLNDADADLAATNSLTQAKFVMRMAVAAKTALHIPNGGSWTTQA